MKLTFIKREGKDDELRVERAGGGKDTMPAPKPGIIPHDMVHYAVESVLARRGFLSLVADGKTSGYRVIGASDAEESVERLVEAFQGEMWGGRVPTPELTEAYCLCCEARGHAALPVAQEDIATIRDRLDELGRRWDEVPVNGSLVLEFERSEAAE